MELSAAHVNVQAYLTDPFGPEGLRDDFDDVIISNVCAPLPEENPEIFDFDWLFGEDHLLDNPKSTVDGSLNILQEIKELLTTNPLIDAEDINDGQLFFDENENMAQSSADDLFCILDSDTIPHQYEQSIIIEEPMVFEEISADLNPYQADEKSMFLPLIDPDPLDNFQLDIENEMSVEIQPTADLRARYGSDGPRFLPGSRKTPMSINLPDLTSVPLPEDHQWGVVIAMVTDDENPQGKRLFHVNQIVYRTNDAFQITPQSTFVPLTPDDLLKRQKKFARASIVCTKFENYEFDITEFNWNVDSQTRGKYTLSNESQITKTAKGKQFVRDYRLYSYRFVFQLAFRSLQTEKILIIPSHHCESHLVNEQRQPKISSEKRRADSDSPAERPVKKAKTSSKGAKRLKVHSK